MIGQKSSDIQSYMLTNLIQFPTGMDASKCALKVGRPAKNLRVAIL